MKAYPFNDRLFDHVLVNHLKKADDIKFCDVSHAFQSVAVVGMLFPTEFNYSGAGFPMPDELLLQDVNMVKASLSQLSQAGIPISPDVRFHIYNLLPPISSDFLLAGLPQQENELPKADLVILNYICSKGFLPNSREFNITKGFPKLDYSTDFYSGTQLVSASRYGDVPNIWANASLNLGAKFISTHGGSYDEISTDHFVEHNDFTIVQSTQSDERERRLSREFRRHSYHPMGLVARKQTLRYYAPYVTRSDKTGAAILNNLGL